MKNSKRQKMPISFPEKYTVIAADLSLRGPGFCKMKIQTVNGKPQIKHIKTYSLNNKQVKATHGFLLEDIRRYFVEIINEDQDNFDNTFFVREAAFNGRGAMAQIGIFEVVGMTNWILYSINKEWDQIYPVSVKKLITGKGKADKIQVAKALEAYVGKLDYSNDNESDATAVAIAWLIQQQQIAQIAQE